MKRKRLYKSRTDKKLCGVCGGIADYFDVDPTIVRILLVVLCFGYCVGFVIYLVAAILMPYEPENSRRTHTDY